ncbi:hypothetical protein BDV96DRAFT_655248 [Lophiotrema nucula]|uniref:Rhodopsin domain-containing protein n=1 Tax=Lophiotrema nucula TaxID=690887 RepID=A0A6A5YI29_9PLEO|nr:hypothetical protein BDV96DRAFT_655248 [Lophiotrema nucula]
MSAIATPTPPPQTLPPTGENGSYVVQNYVLHAVVLFFTTICVGIRVYTRQCIKKFMGVDDYLCVASWCLSVIFSGMLIADNVNGYGRHMWDIDPTKLYMVLKLQFIDEHIYIVLLITLKVSILLTYKRIFGLSVCARAQIWIAITIVTIFYILCLLLALLWCKPLAKAWFPLLEGHCAPYDAHLVLGNASGIFNVITDFYILVFPMPYVWRLNMKTRHKLRVMAVFGLGSFTCVCSIMRVVVTAKYITNPDQIYYFAKYMAFVVLEINIGLICACALVFPAFFDAKLSGSLGSLVSRLWFSRSSSKVASDSSTELQSNRNFTSLHSASEDDPWQTSVLTSMKSGGP